MTRTIHILFLVIFVTEIFQLGYCQNETCPPGFVGSQCVVCQNDQACTTQTNNQKAYCSSNFQFSNASVVKPFICNPTSPSFVTGLLQPDSLLVQCHTGLAPPPSSTPTAPTPTLLPPSIAPSGTIFPAPQTSAPSTAPAPQTSNSPLQQIGQTITNVAGQIGSLINGRRLLQDNTTTTATTNAVNPYCDISFRVKNPDIAVSCKADQCYITPGSSQVSCTQTKCTCVNDPTCGNNALISSLAGSINGKAGFNCQDNGVCSLELAGLPVSNIGANCTTGECIVPYEQSSTNNNNDDDDDTTTNNNTNNTTTTGTITLPIVPPPTTDKPTSYTNLTVDAIIAAVPTMFLSTIICFVGAYTLMNKSLFTPPTATTTAAGAGATTATGAAGRDAKNNAMISPSSSSMIKTYSQPQPLTSHAKIDKLEFKDLCVTVPLGSKAAQQKREALLNKALGLHRFHNHTFSMKRFFIRDPNSQRTTEDDLTPDNSENIREAAQYVVNLHGTGTEWRIIENCNGIIAGGEVAGVIGPSGCGKTTLLGVLAGSSVDLGAGATVTGSVTVDGTQRRSRQIAYVPQADHLIPTLTVLECVRYSALLRLPKGTSSEQIQQQVESTLEELGIRHVAQSQVGGSGMIRGISGGERRRVSIAMELVTDPSIVVLDEPTSGLDSYAALNLIRSLRQVASSGRVVIASLHQPSKDMFYALDKVMLMGQGRMLYMGRPEEAEYSFARIGLKCPRDTAMAEFMLRVANSPSDIMSVLTSKEYQLTMVDSVGGVQRPGSAAYSNGSRGGGVNSSSGGGGGNKDKDNNNTATVNMTTTTNTNNNNTTTNTTTNDNNNNNADDEIESQGPSPSTPASLSPATSPTPIHTLATATTVDSLAGFYLSKKNRPGLARQLAVMFWRTWVDILRNPTLLTLHVCISTFVGIIIGAIFWQLGFDSVGVQNRLGGTFFVLAFLAFTSLTTVDLLMNERAVVMREVRSGYYNPITYLVSKLALDGMLLRVVPAILYWLPFYYMAGFQTQSAHAATYLFILIAFNCAVGALSMMVTIASNTAGQSSFLMNFILLFSLAFTGFLVNVNSIPIGLRWLHYLSVFYYAFEAMLNTELIGQKFLFIYQATPTSTPINIPNIAGETFLITLGFNPENTTLDVCILIALYFAFFVLAVMLFLLRSPKGLGMMKHIRKKRP